MIVVRSNCTRLLVPVFLAWIHLATLGLSAQSVIINEIMYHPASTNKLEEWVELWNQLPLPANLSGWKISKGVSFTFPAGTTIAPGAYLVVTADPATFTRLQPGITNFVGGWTGFLSDDGEEILLEDSSGQTIDSVTYYPEGDWAIRRMGPVDQYGKQGWEWFARHNGQGHSIELINPQLPNDFGLNWDSSLNARGTPGALNSIRSTNVAPLITAVSHFPAVPKTTESVTINTRLIDETPAGSTATLHWKQDGAAAFKADSLLDDGAHGDGLANDGLFGFRIPPQTNGTIIEFYLTARDAEGNERTYPAVIASGDARTANLIFQFDDEIRTGTTPLYRLIMSKAESDYLKDVWSGEPESDAEVNGTFVSMDDVVSDGATTQVRYNAAFRNRGHGTRTSVPHNFHVSLPKDRLWGNRSGINLNTQGTAAQMIGSELMRRAGLPMAESRAVRVRVNGEDLADAGSPQYGAYVANEQFNGTLVKRQIPGDPDGNLYRGIRDVYPGNPKADLAWHGSSYSSYTNAYFKETNEDLKDFSDLVGLVDALNNASDATYVMRVSTVANVSEWMRYFALNTLMDNQETALATGYGDDYGLYRGVSDPRFLLIPYDMDSILGRGTRTTTYADGLFKMIGEGTHLIPTLDRFMKHPEFAPLYYAQLQELADTLFAPENLDPLLDQMIEKFPPNGQIAGAAANMKAFNVSHRAYVLAQVPLEITVTNGPAEQNGYPHTTSSTIPLSGRANAIETRTVMVNGTVAAWSAWQAEWSARVTLHPGLNRVLIETFDEAGHAFAHLDYDIWYDDGTVASESGTIAGNTTWTSSGGPYRVTTSLTIPNGSTLTIEPGATVYLDSGVNLTVAVGGRLLAEGTETAPIRFTRAPGSTGRWGGIVVNGGANSPETRIRFAHLEFNDSTAIHSSGGTVFLDHLTFGTTDKQYVSLDASSFIVRDCIFPSGTAEFELAHGTGGVKAGGHGVFLRNFFGATEGYSDVIDFTGGQRGGPIVHFIDNVFMGSSDDMLDLDGTDAWVEGNIFLHCHKNGSPDSSSAVSGGSDSGQTSEVTIVGNLFFDCDQAATAKQGNFYTLLNNTIVHQTRQGGVDTDGAVVNLNDETVGEGAGMYLEGNIIFDVEKLTRNLNNALVTFTNNLVSLPWAGSGGGNSAANPLLAHVPSLDETQFTSWEEAQLMRQWLSLLPGSPAAGAGPNGQDMGGVVSLGASVHGPGGTNNLSPATLTVGSIRTGNGIPTTGFPQGSGFTHYKWRLDDGLWSAETPINNSIQLTGLTPGPHTVAVVGKRDSGLYQDDAMFAPDAIITSSQPWVVDFAYVAPPAKALVINEVLAKNLATLTSGETTPDLIELRNTTSGNIDLGGVGLSDDSTLPYKFIFAPGTSLPAVGYLVLLADNDTATPGIHLGFNLDQDGETLLLTESAQNGGELLDSVAFGPQIADFSIGRRSDDSWGLCVPTFGSANVAAATGPVSALKINEWLANARFVSSDDFLELYNPGTLPVALGGLFVSDAPGTLERDQIAPLTFIAGGGTTAFRADGDSLGRPNHLNFKLAAEAGTIHLLAPDLTAIDIVSYGPQQTDVSQGRTPSGADELAFFATPTPGSLNPGQGAGETNITYQSSPLFGFANIWKFNADATDLGTAWRSNSFDDSGWRYGPAPLGLDTSSPYPYPLPVQTPLSLTSPSGTRIKTYYFRTHFNAGSDVAGITLHATNYLDDGAVFYLNGARVGAIRISSNPALYTSDAVNQPNEGESEQIEFPTDNLLPGDNILAVEVHQSGNSSTDVMFAMALSAVRATTNVIDSTRNPAILNEVLVRNQTIIGPGGNVAPWVELFNPSTNVIALEDLSLTDTTSTPRRWVFPIGSMILPNGYATITFDTNRSVSATNAPFFLAWNGGSVYLFDSPAKGGGLLDAITYGLQTSDFSVGRIPDGASEWFLTVPSRGSTNVAASLGSPEALRINEWMADPISGPDWFELYNGDGAPVALAGLSFTDDLSNKNKSELQRLSFVGAGRNGFAQFFADKNIVQGANHVDFRLGKSGSPIGLFAPSGLQLDALSFGIQATAVSQGRLPDGNGSVASFPGSASPNAPNTIVVAPTDTDGDGMPDAWEDAHGLNKLVNDATGDLDQDGLNNLDEYLSGTDPQDPENVLALKLEQTVDGHLTLQFEAAPGRSYVVQFNNGFDVNSWRTLEAIPSQEVGRIIVVTDSSPIESLRFYRLTTP